MAFFEPTSSERRGLLILAIVVLLVLALCFVGVLIRSKGDLKSPIPREKKSTTQRHYAVPEQEVETFDFDPNTADSTALLRLGFAPYMVRNIYRYRAAGGRYHEPNDLRRVYGMTNEMWERLAPHVRIDRKYQYVTPAPRSYPERPYEDVREQLAQHRDTSRYPVKLTEGMVVPLNASDTSALKKIPGVGSYYARQIVRYRQQLGGYVSIDQLQEIEGMPEDVGQWLRLDSGAVRRIDVNHATKNQLVRHPYLRVYRARAIYERVHNYGPLRSIEDLRQLPDFTEDDIRRLTPYLEFK